MPSRRKAAIRAKRVYEQAPKPVVVSVSDQGAGIPKEELEKIFEKFYRGSQRRQKPGGTGLGLAISQAIIQNHSGKIWAESEVGRGSTLHFTLPLARKASR